MCINTINTASGRRRQRGNALVEFALIAPLLCLLCLVVFDSGVYLYAFISVQNAARAAALRNSGGSESAIDQAAACSIALDQLRGLPELGGGFQSSCTGAPVVVTSALCSGSGACGNATGSADGAPAALVSVSYSLPALFRVPLTAATTISISSQMKLRSAE